MLCGFLLLQIRNRHHFNSRRYAPCSFPSGAVRLQDVRLPCSHYQSIALLSPPDIFVSFFMIDRVFTGYIGSRYAIRQTEKEFGVNTADAGYVHFVTRDIKQDISDKVYEYMSTLPEVVRSGYILSATLFEEEDEPIQVNIIDKDIAAIGNLMLSEEDKKILENLGEDERIVFAGYNYRKQYHAGDMINCYVDDDIGKIKIGGILKKGAGWIHEDRLFKGSYGKWDNYTLDDSMIVIAGSLR